MCKWSDYKMERWNRSAEGSITIILCIQLIAVQARKTINVPIEWWLFIRSQLFLRGNSIYPLFWSEKIEQFSKIHIATFFIESANCFFHEMLIGKSNSIKKMFLLLMHEIRSVCFLFSQCNSIRMNPLGRYLGSNNGIGKTCRNISSLKNDVQNVCVSHKRCLMCVKLCRWMEPIFWITSVYGMKTSSADMHSTCTRIQNWRLHALNRL